VPKKAKYKALMARRWAVKNAYELLREKETVIVRLRQEIEALRCVIPLLADDRHQADDETSEWQAPHAPGNGTAGKKFWP
jgi:hypothetical protein